jgi:hypothetical protein
MHPADALHCYATKLDRHCQRCHLKVALGPVLLLSDQLSKHTPCSNILTYDTPPALPYHKPFPPITTRAYVVGHWEAGGGVVVTSTSKAA